MNYKQYNAWLNRPARVVKKRNKDYEEVDKNGKVCLILIIVFTFSAFIVNWGNNVIKVFEN